MASDGNAVKITGISLNEIPRVERRTREVGLQPNPLKTHARKEGAKEWER